MMTPVGLARSVPAAPWLVRRPARRAGDGEQGGEGQPQWAASAGPTRAQGRTGDVARERHLRGAGEDAAGGVSSATSVRSDSRIGFFRSPNREHLATVPTEQHHATALPAVHPDRYDDIKTVLLCGTPVSGVTVYETDDHVEIGSPPDLA